MDEISYIRVMAAFLFVIALIFFLSWALKRIKSSQWVDKVQGERRLKIIEQVYIDNKNKLVLVRCDEQEHLVLIGAQGGNQFIAQNQMRGAGLRCDFLRYS